MPFVNIQFTDPVLGTQYVQSFDGTNFTQSSIQADSTQEFKDGSLGFNNCCNAVVAAKGTESHPTSVLPVHH